MGIQFEVIGRAVVLVMLPHPPGPAHAEQKADAEADDFISPQGSENRPMPGIMSNVPNLTVNEG